MGSQGSDAPGQAGGDRDVKMEDGDEDAKQINPEGQDSAMDGEARGALAESSRTYVIEE